MVQLQSSSLRLLFLSQVRRFCFFWLPQVLSWRDIFPSGLSLTPFRRVPPALLKTAPFHVVMQKFRRCHHFLFHITSSRIVTSPTPEIFDWCVMTENDYKCEMRRKCSGKLHIALYFGVGIIEACRVPNVFSWWFQPLIRFTFDVTTSDIISPEFHHSSASSLPKPLLLLTFLLFSFLIRSIVFAYPWNVVLVTSCQLWSASLNLRKAQSGSAIALCRF